MKFTRVVPDVDGEIRYEEIDSNALDGALLAAAQESLRQLRDGRADWVYSKDDQLVYTVALGTPAIQPHPSAVPAVLEARQALMTSRLHFHIRQQTHESWSNHAQEPHCTLYRILPRQPTGTHDVDLRGLIFGALGAMAMSRFIRSEAGVGVTPTEEQLKAIVKRFDRRPSREEIDAAAAGVDAARPGYICVGRNSGKFTPFADCFAATLLAEGNE